MEHKEFIKHVKSQEQLLLKKKLEANMKKMQETQDLRKTVLEIAFKKRQLTPRSK
jgi:hypothetical protein